MNIKVSNTSSLLINEPPLQVLPSLAVALKNINEAVMLQQVQYWLSRSNNEFEGRKWIYNTIDEWQNQFPWLTERAVRDRFNSLIEKGIILTANFNKAKFDRTKWYSIDYDKLNSLFSNENTAKKPTTMHSEETSRSRRKKVPNPSGRNLQMQAEESSDLDSEVSSGPIPRDYQDNSIDYTETTIIESQIEIDFKNLWNLYPKKVGESEAFEFYKNWILDNPSEHTYLLMRSKLECYLKYLKINDISFRYILNGNNWFAGRFNDELDLSEKRSSSPNQSHKKIRKVMDWDKYAKEHPVKKNTDTSRKELQQEWKQTIRAIEGDDEKDIKENSNSSTSIQTSVFKDTENSDFTMNAEETKQLYHDSGIDDLLE